MMFVKNKETLMRVREERTMEKIIVYRESGILGRFMRHYMCFTNLCERLIKECSIRHSPKQYFMDKIEEEENT